MAKENPMAIPGGGGAALRAATNKALANSAKGKLQTPTAAAARSAGKITGEGGKNVTPIYKQSIPPASVKVVPAMPGRAEISKIESRWKSDPFARAEQKAGQLRADTAKAAAAPKKSTIKINSNK